MPLSDDQRAMLQLLLERDQSYEDIGGLLGLDSGEVRSRARAALAEIGGRDPDAEVGLTDFLLGQADPIGRADAARHLQSDPDARDLAERLVTQLKVLAPKASLPDLPAGRAGATRGPRAAAKDDAKPAPGPVAAEPGRESTGGFASNLSRGQRQLIAALLGGGVLVVIIVLIATGTFGGDGDEGGASDQGSSGRAANASGLTRAVLRQQDGSGASGVAVFAQARNTPVLQINVNGLQPSAKGEAYVIWLYGSDSRAFPLSREPVKGKNLRGAAPIPNQVLQALQQGLFDSIDVSLSSNAEMTAALRKARKDQQLPRYSGRSVARGTITGPGFTSNSKASKN